MASSWDYLKKWWKYVGQKDDDECTPIALANSLIWAGEKISYPKNKSLLKTICKYKIGNGSSSDQFAKAMDLLSYKFDSVEFDEKAKVDNIIYHIRHYGACSVIYQSAKKAFHHCLIIGTYRFTDLVIVNYKGPRGKKIQHVSYEQLKYDVEDIKYPDRLWCWFLKK